MNSALYTGRVRHRRFGPVEHAFTYRQFLVWLDLSELDRAFGDVPFVSVGRANLAWFRRADYLGDARVPLDDAVRELVEARTGRRPEGPIRLLTHLRMLGHCFNPVSFYYCYDVDDTRVESVVAEITNTPWGERFAYVLPRDEASSSVRRRFDKTFHVSPFMPMDVQYDWRFTEPGRRLAVHMENHRDGALVFDATMTMERVPLTAAAFARFLVTRPFGTLRVLAAIYRHALRLWWKGVPFHPHPGKRDDARDDPHAPVHAPA